MVQHSKARQKGTKKHEACDKIHPGDIFTQGNWLRSLISFVNEFYCHFMVIFILCKMPLSNEFLRQRKEYYGAKKNFLIYIYLSMCSMYSTSSHLIFSIFFFISSHLREMCLEHVGNLIEILCDFSLHIFHKNLLSWHFKYYRMLWNSLASSERVFLCETAPLTQILR